MSDMLHIGLRSLVAYKAALTVTSLNLANAPNQYYSRRDVTLVESLYSNGVDVGSVTRIYDDYLSRIVINANSQQGMSDALYKELAQLEPMLQSDTDGVNVYLNEALKAIKDLNSNKSDRNLFLNKLNALAGRFNGIGNQLAQEQTNLNSSISATVSNINQLTAQLAEINTQLSNSVGGDNSDLLDTQEMLTQQLAGLINFSTQKDDNGVLTISLDNGISIVNGGTSQNLVTSINPKNPDLLNIGVQLQLGVTDVTSYIQSGSLGGMYQAISSIQTARNALDKVALNVGELFNKQNIKGVDANGNLGAYIFNDINSATAQSNRVLTMLTNLGSEQITASISDSTQLTGSDYSLKFDSANHYVLTRLSDQTVVSSGAVGALPMSINVDGFNTTIGNTAITVGDQFIITPTKSGAKNLSVAITDPKFLALAWPVSTSSATNNTGTGVIEVTDITDITNGAFSIPRQLNPPITIKFKSATQYQLVNANDGTIIEDNIAYDPIQGAAVFPTPGGYDPGYRVSLSGVINDKDSFNIGYNSTALGNKNGLAIEKIFTTGAFTENYRLIADDISQQTNHANIADISSEALLAQAETRFAETSGVVMEEEMSNLMLFNEAYQASAKILEVANSVFEVLMGLTRGV